MAICQRSVWSQGNWIGTLWLPQRELDCSDLPFGGRTSEAWLYQHELVTEPQKAWAGKNRMVLFSRVRSFFSDAPCSFRGGGAACRSAHKPAQK